jgi:hypothetical protein
MKGKEAALSVHLLFQSSLMFPSSHYLFLSHTVAELDAAAFAPPNLTIVWATVTGLDLEGRRVLLEAVPGWAGRGENEGGEVGDAIAHHTPPPFLAFDRLVVATGATPRAVADHRAVMVLRDAASVAHLAAALQGARTVVVAGNGGIALGLAHALSAGGGGGGGSASPPSPPPPPLRVVWVAKHGHVGDAFFDVDAAGFLARHLGKKRKGAGEAGVTRGGGPAGAPAPLSASARGPAAAATPPTAPPSTGFGAAAGPGWVGALTAAVPGQGDASGGAHTGGSSRGGRLETHLHVTIASVSDAPPPAPASACPPFAVRVILSDGTLIDADAVISAVGVSPAVGWVPACVRRAGDGGLEVDGEMRSTSHPHLLLAAGDAATLRPADRGPHWFPMRLWSQARLTGGVAGAAAAGGGSPLDRPGGMGLELFAHATAFADLPVVLLGAYNGQGLPGGGEGVVTYAREDEEGSPGGPSFARVLLHRGRLAGCVLIGDGATALAGVFEDLILDGVDVGFLGARILDPELDLEAVFD